MKKIKVKRIKRHPLEGALIYKTVVVFGDYVFPTIKGASGYDFYSTGGYYLGSVGKTRKYIRVKVT